MINKTNVRKIETSTHPENYNWKGKDYLIIAISIIYTYNVFTTMYYIVSYYYKWR